MSNLPVPISKRAIIAYESRGIPTYLNHDEIHRLLDACQNKRDHLLINLAWQTGARVSELVSLTRDGIDLYNHQIKFITLKKRRNRGKTKVKTAQLN